MRKRHHLIQEARQTRTVANAQKERSNVAPTANPTATTADGAYGLKKLVFTNFTPLTTNGVNALVTLARNYFAHYFEDPQKDN